MSLSRILEVLAKQILVQTKEPPTLVLGLRRKVVFPLLYAISWVMSHCLLSWGALFSQTYWLLIGDGFLFYQMGFWCLLKWSMLFFFLSGGVNISCILNYIFSQLASLLNRSFTLIKWCLSISPPLSFLAATIPLFISMILSVDWSLSTAPTRAGSWRPSTQWVLWMNPRGLRHLNTQSPVSGAAKELVCAALLEKVHHCEQSLGVHSLTLLSGCFTCFLCKVEGVTCQLPAPDTMLASCCCRGSLPWWTTSLWSLKPK